VTSTVSIGAVSRGEFGEGENFGVSMLAGALGAQVGRGLGEGLGEREDPPALPPPKEAPPPNPPPPVRSTRGGGRRFARVPVTWTVSSSSSATSYRLRSFRILLM